MTIKRANMDDANWAEWTQLAHDPRVVMREARFTCLACGCVRTLTFYRLDRLLDFKCVCCLGNLWIGPDVPTH